MKQLLIILAVLFAVEATAFNMNQNKLITACDMSTAICTSRGQDLELSKDFAIQAVFSGAPVGTFKLQVSSDQVPVGTAGKDPAVNVVNWSDYTGSSQDISAAGTFLWNFPNAGYRWVRLIYTKTSGTGSLTATFSGKD